MSGKMQMRALRSARADWTISLAFDLRRRHVLSTRVPRTASLTLSVGIETAIYIYSKHVLSTRVPSTASLTLSVGIETAILIYTVCIYIYIYIYIYIQSPPFITRWSGSMTSKRFISEARYRFCRQGELA